MSQIVQNNNYTNGATNGTTNGTANGVANGVKPVNGLVNTNVAEL